MLRIYENKDGIVIREIPDFLTIAVITSIIISFILGILFLLRATSLSLNFFFGAILFVALFIIIISPITTIKLSKESRFITVKKRSLIKNEFKIYPFREIADLIFLEEHKTSKGEITYDFIMPLKSGEKIKLLNMASSNTGKYFNAANFMNDIIFDSQFKISAFNEI